jgi:kumamolisin
MTNAVDPRRVELPGSDRPAARAARAASPADPRAEVEVTLVLRRQQALPPDLVSGTATVDRAELARTYGASAEDVAATVDAVEQAGLAVTDVDAGSRRVVVRGPLAAAAAAFGTQLEEVTSEGPDGEPVRHRHREGSLSVPEQLAGVVVAVLGLDDRPQARAHFRAAPRAASTSYTPVELARVYSFPDDLDGSGTTVAILELGGGFGTGDLTTYFSSLGVPQPSVRAVGVDGGSNAPGADPTGADGEVLLDIEVAGALAPGADFLVYFAPNTDRGFLDALSTAVHASPTPAAVSISWGGPEESWTAQARTAFDDALADAAALGVTVLAAAGDNGSGDGVDDGEPHTDFPASSPNVLACGGTSLTARGGVVSAEVVWNGHGATGGGVSAAFARPAWQEGVGVPARAGGGGTGGAGGRGVPDVAAVADPVTGYQVLVDGQQQVIGGTSAVAPLWTGLVARLVQARGGRGLGLLAPLLYAGASAGSVAAGFRDITSGNNGDYTAGAGWDPCTGLGVPDGQALRERLQG